MRCTASFGPTNWKITFKTKQPASPHFDSCMREGHDEHFSPLQRGERDGYASKPEDSMIPEPGPGSSISDRLYYRGYVAGLKKLWRELDKQSPMQARIIHASSPEFDVLLAQVMTQLDESEEWGDDDKEPTRAP